MNTKSRQVRPSRSIETKRLPGQRGEATDTTYLNLYRLAHELGPNAKLPPVRNLREQFGVSQSTLDAALDRLERQHILMRRERSGVYVSSGLRDQNICLLYAPNYFVQFGESPFWSDLFKRIQDRASQSDIRLSVAFTEMISDRSASEQEPINSSPLPRWLKEDIEANKVHGVLSIGVPHPVSRWIEAHDVPVVAFAGGAQHMVALSYGTLIQLGVATLARQGCQRISFWRFPRTVQPRTEVALRDETFIGALAAHEMTLVENGRIDEATSHLSTDIGWELALRQFGPGCDPDRIPDGIVVETDMIAHGGLSALQRLGVNIGDEVKVAAHGNRGLHVLRPWEDRIWRLEFDLDELVGSLFETISLLTPPSGEDSPSLPSDLPDGSTTPPVERFRIIHPRLTPPSPSLRNSTALADASRTPM